MKDEQKGSQKKQTPQNLSEKTQSEKKGVSTGVPVKTTGRSPVTAGGSGVNTGKSEFDASSSMDETGKQPAAAGGAKVDTGGAESSASSAPGVAVKTGGAAAKSALKAQKSMDKNTSSKEKTGTQVTAGTGDAKKNTCFFF